MSHTGVCLTQAQKLRFQPHTPLTQPVHWPPFSTESTEFLVYSTCLLEQRFGQNTRKVNWQDRWAGFAQAVSWFVNLGCQELPLLVTPFPHPFLALRNSFTSPRKAFCPRKSGLRSCHRSPLSVSWDHCQGLCLLAGDVEGPCSIPSVQGWREKLDLLLSSSPLPSNPKFHG